MFCLHMLMKCHAFKELMAITSGEIVFSCNSLLNLLFILLINSNSLFEG